MRHIFSSSIRLVTLALTAASLFGCSSKPVQNASAISTAGTPTVQQYPSRPTTPPPPFKLFHQSPNTITLTTVPAATDDQIAAILYQLRDAAQTHTFDALHIPQKLVDARDPYMWFHLYRGPKCAAEKYATGQPPCGPSYHAAGDFTLGGFTNHNHTEAAVLHDETHQTNLFNSNTF